MKLLYICDKKRHLVCIPYSIDNLHQMADDLNIDRAWFHRTKGLEHYDLPLERIQEITSKCIVVSPKNIVRIIRGDITNLAQ
jgi:hypothetical protein